MAELVPYNTGGTLYFPLIGSGTAAWTTAASGSLSGTNILVSKDGGAFASSTNTGTVVGSGLYQWVYTTSETSAKQVTVLIGAGTLSTVVEFQAFQFRTYGNANAFYPSDVLSSAMANHTVGTVSFVATGTVSTVTSPIGTVSTVLVSQSATVVGTPAVNVTQVAGTAATHTLVVDVTKASGTNITAANGTMQVNATTGTVVASTLTNIGAISTLTSGTFDANLIQVLGTAVTGTQGFASVNVARWSGTAAPGAAGTPIARAATLTDVGTLDDGTFSVSTVTNAIGTVSTVLVVLGTPAVDVTAWKGTAAAGTQGTPFARATTLTDIGAISTLTSGTFDANLVNVKGTAAAGTQGTLEVSVAALTATRATLTAVTPGTASPLQQLDWMYTVSRSQLDQETGTQKVYNPNNTLISTAIVSDDGGSYRRGSFV